jgi:hypothetical protein
MKNWVYWSLICFFAMMLTGASQSADKPVVVNLMVDMVMPANGTPNLQIPQEQEMMNIFNGFNKENIKYWTFIQTRDAAYEGRLFAAQLAIFGTLEPAMSGNHSDEKLSTKSFPEQKGIMERTKLSVEECKVCTVNELHVQGFMPQSFDQNEDTYKALDALGFEWDAGFKAGILYAPGHEKDVWPYKVENHKFYAVPVSTYTISGDNVALDDREAKAKGLSSSQWKDALVGKFNEVSGKDEPMVVSLSSSVSGTGYLDALNQFLAYAVSKNANFVTTHQLVQMSITGVHEVAATSTECPECEAANKTAQNVSHEMENNTIMVGNPFK